MLWQSSGRTTEPEPGGRVDLRSLAGQPGRLSYAEGYGGHRMAHIACTVRKVDAAEITLEVSSTAAIPHAETAVILEVANHHALVQCFTTILSAGKGGSVSLRTPARPHVVQRRRFPRIDLFLGITLHTPDRPIESVAAQMINLSIDGAAVVLAEPIQPGTAVTLNLTNLGFHPPEVAASVRRCGPTPSRLWVVGLQFERIDASQEIYLAKYISDYLETHQSQP